MASPFHDTAAEEVLADLDRELLAQLPCSLTQDTQDFDADAAYALAQLPQLQAARATPVPQQQPLQDDLPGPTRMWGGSPVASGVLPALTTPAEVANVPEAVALVASGRGRPSTRAAGEKRRMGFRALDAFPVACRAQLSFSSLVYMLTQITQPGNKLNFTLLSYRFPLSPLQC